MGIGCSLRKAASVIRVEIDEESEPANGIKHCFQLALLGERIHVRLWAGVGVICIKAGAPDRDHLCARTQGVTNLQPQTQWTTTMRVLALDLGKLNTICCFVDSKT